MEKEELPDKVITREKFTLEIYYEPCPEAEREVLEYLLRDYPARRALRKAKSKE
jgi:hypothetical protein